MNKYNYQGPEQFRSLSPWAYFGYTILFSIPIVGFILLIVFSVSNDNINRRNFARSYWCIYVIIAIVCAVLIATVITAFSALSFSNLI